MPTKLSTLEHQLGNQADLLLNIMIDMRNLASLLAEQHGSSRDIHALKLYQAQLVNTATSIGPEYLNWLVGLLEEINNRGH